MTIYWSNSTTGFFDSRINRSIPDDAVEITDEYRGKLLEGMRNAQIIVTDEQGWPVLRDPPPATPLELEAIEREWRDTELVRVIWLRDRHRDQLEADLDTTLDPEQFSRLLRFIQALRDWPQSAEFPDVDRRPVMPDFVASQFK